MAKVSQARLVAYDVLRDVDERDAYANLALPSRIAQAQLSAQDARFATELVSQTLRLQGTYDAIIQLAAGRDCAQIDGRTLRVLRLGAHQLLQMRVPQHAALNESVELQKLVANRGAAGFVNAVLRKIAARTLQEWEHAFAQHYSGDALLAVRSSHPEWIVRALRDCVRKELQQRAAQPAQNSDAAQALVDELHALLAADNQAPRVQLALLPQASRSPEQLIAKAVACLPENISAAGLSPFAVQLRAITPAAAIQKLADCGITARVQDQGSQLAALLLRHAQPLTDAERWLDLCAGPGGKTALLAAEAEALTATGTPVQLRANEVAAHRAQLVANAVAAHSQRVEIVNFDGTTDQAFAGFSYHRILVDAPCSGLGALRRRPEARWRKQPHDLPQLTKLQQRLLTKAAAHLVPGGVLAYVTCSPHLAETTGQISRFLSAHPDFTQLDTAAVAREVCPDPQLILPGSAKHLQLLPNRHEADAMFIALLRKAD